MTSAVELEVQHVHLASEQPNLAEAIVRQCADPRQPGLRLILSQSDGHQLAHELQGQETPRSHAVAVMAEVVACLGGRLSLASLRPDGTGQLVGMLTLELPGGCVNLRVSPGQALAVAVRLGVPLQGDPGLFARCGAAAATTGDSAIGQFLNSLDLSGLGS